MSLRLRPQTKTQVQKKSLLQNIILESKMMWPSYLALCSFALISLLLIGYKLDRLQGPDREPPSVI